MTNEQKTELRYLARQGYSFKEIREIVDCSDSTIKLYMKIFNRVKDKNGKLRRK
jgi:transposase